MCRLKRPFFLPGGITMKTHARCLSLCAGVTIVILGICVRATAEELRWPFLRHYDRNHLARVALPLGGIGTGTVSLGGRGDLRDWEIVNRPAKGFTPGPGFFVISVAPPGGRRMTRLLQGPVEFADYEGPSGARASTSPGLPRFRSCSFDAGYPFGQVNLSDRSLPCDVRIRAFNPLIPADPDASGIPIAVIRFSVTNKTSRPLDVALCGSIQNFVGNDGKKSLASGNTNTYRQSPGIAGLYMTSDGVDSNAEQWGSIALTTPDSGSVSYRTGWLPDRWGTPLLDFWNDISDDGILTNRTSASQTPWGSLALRKSVAPRSTREFTFFITWHFPNRFAWSPVAVGNFYATRYTDAWDVAVKTAPEIGRLEQETVRFASAFCSSSLPGAVKEAALFNLSTLRSQTCFRTADGTLYAWEGCGENEGCCWGSCTHVWNYEQAIPFLFGSLAQSMRRVEFGTQTDSAGLMSFRAALPHDAKLWGKAAADGQMGCIMKLYRDWQLSGNGKLLDSLWPNAKKALEFCWIPGGWDADRNGVMEGAQHNTMDVEYYGPNGQMEIWYLGALRAAEKMAMHQGDREFAEACRSLAARGEAWTDAHLFNGRYYVQIVQPPADSSRIAPGLVVGMGAVDFRKPDYQLGDACLVDQLVGQYMAHVCGLGYLVDPSHVRATLRSIMKYNFRESLSDHFNCMRTFALGDESALLMAAYPEARPENPFPYFSEVMTGFEYTAANGMLYEGQVGNALRCIRSVRARYDGLKRNPYDEAECGHHYGRAMASWGAVLAITGFHYSAVEGTLTFRAENGNFFWSNGYAYGTVNQEDAGSERRVTISSLRGEIGFKELVITRIGKKLFERSQLLKSGESLIVNIPR
jgi:non-lysosomal glucosylceramidase